MVSTVLFLLVAVLAVGEFLLFGALAEAYRDIRQLREHGGVVDTPVPVDLGGHLGSMASSVGMAADLDLSSRTTVVYLDKRCGTCQMIMASLGGGIPSGLWLSVIADSAQEAYEWLGEAGIAQNSEAAARVMVTTPANAEKHLGIQSTPLAIELEHGRVARAKTVPSVRQFYALVPHRPSLKTAGIS
jgi:hypothetical protein